MHSKKQIAFQQSISDNSLPNKFFLPNEQTKRHSTRWLSVFSEMHLWTDVCYWNQSSRVSSDIQLAENMRGLSLTFNQSCWQLLNLNIMLASPLEVGTRTSEKSFVTMEMVDKNRNRLMFNAILVNGKPDSPNQASSKTPKHRDDDASCWNLLQNFDLRPKRWSSLSFQTFISRRMLARWFLLGAEANKGRDHKSRRQSGFAHIPEMFSHPAGDAGSKNFHGAIWRPRFTSFVTQST